MSKRKDTLRQYTADMLALSRHIQRATNRQYNDPTVQHMPDVFRLIESIDKTLRRQNEALEAHADHFQFTLVDDVKTTIAEWLGAAAGVYDQIRPNTISRMLRDDYTALSLAAISYTMLHTTGLAMQNDDPNDALGRETAEISQNHLTELTPLIVEISRVMPSVVNVELLEDFKGVDLTVAENATATTQQAWRSENTDQYEPVR